MSYDLFVDSANAVSFEPEWDFEPRDRKIQDEHRTRDGSRFVYLWGSFKGWRFGARFVSSADASVVNSWWSQNTKLLFKSTSDTAVFSVQLVGSRPPLARFIPPYDDQLQGVIELETY